MYRNASKNSEIIKSESWLVSSYRRKILKEVFIYGAIIGHYCPGPSVDRIVSLIHWLLGGDVRRGVGHSMGFHLKSAKHAYRGPEWDSNTFSGFEWKQIKLTLACMVTAIIKNSESQSPNPPFNHRSPECKTVTLKHTGTAFGLEGT